MQKQSNQHHGVIEARALYASFIGGGLGFVIGLVSFWGRDVTLFERGVSLGFIAAILGGVLGLAMYMIVALPHDKKGAKTRREITKAYVNTTSLGLVHGLLVFLMYAVLFYVVGQSFIGATIDMWAASILVALSAGAACYAVYLSAKQINAARISILIALFLLSGTFISMLTAGDPQWWYYHFSSLGANGGVSAYSFNATLIITGLIVVALSDYIAKDLATLYTNNEHENRVRRVIFQVLLSGIGIALACVGAFVYDVYPLIHNAAAGGMAVLFLCIIIGLPWLMPRFTKAYYIASYLLLAALAVSVWLFSVTGYFNLTVFELVAAAIIFTWLIVFVRHLAAMLEDTKQHTNAI